MGIWIVPVLLCLIISTLADTELILMNNCYGENTGSSGEGTLCTWNFVINNNHYNDNYCRTISIPNTRIITCTNVSWKINKPKFSSGNDFSLGEYRYDLNTKEEIEIEIPNTLKITDSDIPVLPPSAFQEIIILKVIYLNNSNIDKILPGAFNFQTEIETIYLNRNNLTTIISGIFNSLTQLKLLDLSYNSIETISEHAFQATKLSTLYLNNNKLKVFNTIMSSLENLIYLDVSYNNISETEIAVSNKLLETLLINNNNIQSVKFQQFNNVFKRIDLSSNSINGLNNFDSLQAKEIYINNNQIQQIKRNDYVEILGINNNLFTELNASMLGINLKKLFANNNLFKSLDVDTLKELHELEGLSLSGNKLTEITKCVFKNNVLLQHLDLSLNSLTDFSYGTFDNLNLLQSLNISFNNFVTMPLHILHPLKNLFNFYVQGNKIHNIDADDLFKYLPNLQEINLDENPWYCKNLLELVVALDRKNVKVVSGTTKSNRVDTVHGVKCSKENEVKSDNIQQQDGNLSEDSFYKSDLFRYFNKDFEKSNFFKYLESFNNTHLRLLNKSKDVNSDLIIQKYFEGLNTTLENFLKKELQFFKNNSDSRFENLVNSSSQDLVKILEHFKDKDVSNDLIVQKYLDGLNKTFENFKTEVTKEFRQISEISSRTSEIDNSTKQFFKLFLEKVSSINSISKVNFSTLETSLEKTEDFERILSDKLTKTKEENQTQNMYSIQIVNVLMLVVITFFLSVIVFIVFNVYRKNRIVNLQEMEMGQLLQSKS